MDSPTTRCSRKNSLQGHFIPKHLENSELCYAQTNAIIVEINKTLSEGINEKVCVAFALG